MSRSQRLLLGIVVLLIVDVLWVGSSELTEYIFKTTKYDKPFFSTFVKTALFILYLPGFIFLKSWREQCCVHKVTTTKDRKYNLLLESDNEDDVEENEEDENDDLEVPEPSLSTPIFLPIKSDDRSSESEGELRVKSVRFNRITEVRQMSKEDALAANLSRLSYGASQRATAALTRIANRLSVKDVALLSLFFFLPFFSGNLCFQSGLSETEAGVVHVLSSTSCLFTLFLGSFFPSNATTDKLTLSKFLAVLFSISGVILVSYSDLALESSGVPKGALWALAGAIFYSLYVIFLRRKVDHEDKMDIAMFFGFVGLFSAIFLWPIILLCHFSGIENFSLPSRTQWIYLLLNGVFGTVVSELLWLWGCFLTSSLIATLAMSLTIPLTMLADILFRKIKYDALFYVGSLPIFLSFFLVSLLTHYDEWDPVLDFLIWLRSFFPSPNAAKPSSNEREALLIANESSQNIIE